MRMCKFTLDDGTVEKMTSDEANNLEMENGMIKKFGMKKIINVEFFEEYEQ